jgi:transposase
MKKISKPSYQVKAAKPERSVGLDLGGRFIHYCVLNQEGEVIEEGRMQSSETALRKHFADEAVMRIAMEAGTHLPWVSRLVKRLGHQVLVANPRHHRQRIEKRPQRCRAVGPLCRLRSQASVSD